MLWRNQVAAAIAHHWPSLSVEFWFAFDIIFLILESKVLILLWILQIQIESWNLRMRLSRLRVRVHFFLAESHRPALIAIWYPLFLSQKGWALLVILFWAKASFLRKEKRLASLLSLVPQNQLTWFREWTWPKDQDDKAVFFSKNESKINSNSYHRWLARQEFCVLSSPDPGWRWTKINPWDSWNLKDQKQWATGFSWRENVKYFDFCNENGEFVRRSVLEVVMEFTQVIQQFLEQMYLK